MQWSWWEEENAEWVSWRLKMHCLIQQRSAQTRASGGKLIKLKPLMHCLQINEYKLSWGLIKIWLHWSVCGQWSAKEGELNLSELKALLHCLHMRFELKLSSTKKDSRYLLYHHCTFKKNTLFKENLQNSAPICKERLCKHELQLSWVRRYVVVISSQKAYLFGVLFSFFPYFLLFVCCNIFSTCMCNQQTDRQRERKRQRISIYKYVT